MHMKHVPIVLEHADMKTKIIIQYTKCFAKPIPVSSCFIQVPHDCVTKWTDQPSLEHLDRGCKHLQRPQCQKWPGPKNDSDDVQNVQTDSKQN